jgi:DNA-binding response OmpR family regulator
VKILIADQAPSVREAAIAQLRDEGYDVVAAPDGDRALELARSSLPDLVVLDRAIPVLDAFEVVSALAGDPRTRSVRIMMTAEHPTESDVLRGMSLGVRDYIAKPLSPRDLSARVHRVLWRDTC